MQIDKETFVILTPGFPESESDSTCLPLHQAFARSLKKLYPKLQIIILAFQYPYHTKRYTWFDIPVIPFSGKNRGNINLLLRRRKINSVLEEINKSGRIIGLLSFWCTECALIGKDFADANGLKHISWIRGQDARKGNHFVKKIKPQPMELATISDFLQNEFDKNHNIRPAYVVPPGIDPTIFSNIEMKRNIDILGVGSLIALKQYSLFLEIIAGIKEEFPGIKAVICGKGPEGKKLLALVNTLNLQNNVTLKGELPYPELLRQMQQAKLFLHTSNYEGFPCVCLEALHAGNHVISFCKAMNHSISKWHSVKNSEEMAQRSLEILRDPSIEFKPVTPYTADNSAKKIIQLFTGQEI